MFFYWTGILLLCLLNKPGLRERGAKTQEHVLLTLLERRLQLEWKKISWSYWFWFLLVCVFWSSVLWVSPFLSYFGIDLGLNSLDRKGLFGDSFGAINTLFAGLAFAGVILALKYQRDELGIQRRELKEQRLAMQKETFERTFFQLLETLNARRASMVCSFDIEIYDATKVCTEDELVEHLRPYLEKTGEACDVSAFPTKRDGKIYLKVTTKGEDVFFWATRKRVEYHMQDEPRFIVTEWGPDGVDIHRSFYPYFSLLYRILRFIDQANFCKNYKKFYTDILRDQMSNDEPLLLFLLGKKLGFYRNKSIDGIVFKTLIQRYALLSHIHFYNHTSLYNLHHNSD